MTEQKPFCSRDGTGAESDERARAVLSLGPVLLLISTMTVASP